MMMSAATAAATIPLTALTLRRGAGLGVRCKAAGGGGTSEDSDLNNYFKERDARIRRGLVGKTMSPDSLESSVTRREERAAAAAEEEKQEAAKAKERNEAIKYTILTLILYGWTKTIKEPRQSMVQLLILLFLWIMRKQKVEGSRGVGGQPNC